ncbi:MAG: radical SAM family heme chaperone HemW [Bacteroidetes bacterium]|nr:radical SAM family heme chaperone HemW [Bacteroidota bacterium]
MALVYIHIPFCKQKCTYCDFCSLPVLEVGFSSIERYFECLRDEIHRRTSLLKEIKSIDTIYFGGGTPSLAPPKYLSTLLHDLATVVPFSTNHEISIEINPGTVTYEDLCAYRRFGINRISIGVQSFNNDELQFLGRIHTGEDARRCIEAAKEAGFTNISVDIICALPQQTKESLLSNLRTVVAYGVHHVSCYTLMVEPQTPLYAMVRDGRVVPLNDEVTAELYLAASEYLRSQGYVQYEVSNYAKPGYECRHNCGYWYREPYFGFGASAHSFFERRRWWNTNDIQQYCELIERGTLPLSGEEELTDENIRQEVLYLGLRSKGVDCRLYEMLFGENFYDRYREIIDDLVIHKYACYENNYFRLTPIGYAMCDELCQRFL